MNRNRRNHLPILKSLFACSAESPHHSQQVEVGVNRAAKRQRASDVIPVTGKLKVLKVLEARKATASIMNLVHCHVLGQEGSETPSRARNSYF